MSIECQTLSRKRRYIECGKSIEVNGNQGTYTRKNLFIGAKKSPIHKTSINCKKLKIRGEYLDYQLSHLSDTNEIIACSMILPYQQQKSPSEAIEKLNIEETQGNATTSEVPKFKCKEVACRDGQELCIEKGEKKVVNQNVSTNWKKRIKTPQSTKRRGRPQKNHNISCNMFCRPVDQFENIPLKHVENKSSSILKPCRRVNESMNKSFHKTMKNLVLRKDASCINPTQLLSNNQNFQQISFSSKIGENQKMKNFFFDLRPSSTTHASLNKKGKDVLCGEETWMYRRRSKRDGKPKNRAVMDILALDIKEMPKIEHVFMRKKSLELSTIKDTNYNNNIFLPRWKDLKKEDLDESMSNKSMVPCLPTKRGRGRPRKWPLKDIKKESCTLRTDIWNEDNSKIIHKITTSFHGERTHRKNSSKNKSLGCARCSISLWTWHWWTHNGAKQKLQQNKSIDVSFWSNTNAFSCVQSARTNRATFRKLVIAAEGSDKVKFNQLKVCFYS